MGLEVKNLSFSYDSKNYVLNDISFNVKNGEILSLLGPNGTGKTTLLKSICCMNKPKSGSIFVDDIDISSLNINKRAQYIGYVPQNCNTPFALTVADTVLMGRTAVSKKIKDEDKDIAFDTIKKLNLEKIAFKYTNQISGGERQRVFIARAIAQSPKILVLDEPTSSLDLKNQLNIMECIESIANDQKIGVVMSIHDINLSIMFSNTVMIIKNSNVFKYGKPKDVFSEETIKAVYEVNSKVVKDDDLFVRLLR